MRRFLLGAPPRFTQPLGRVNDRLLQFFTPLPSRRSRLILDLDSTGVTVFGRPEGAEVGYNPRPRGQRSYQPLLCVEAHSAPLCAPRLPPGDIDPHRGTVEWFRDGWSHVPAPIREVRLRADAGFYHDAFLSELEDREAHDAVVAKLYPPWKRLLPGILDHRVHLVWAMGECQDGAQPWFEPRRHVVARRLIEPSDPAPTLFTLGRYPYRCWVTNLDLSPLGVQHFYDGRAAIEVRIRELRQDFAFAHIPTRRLAAHALYLEIIRLAYNLVTAFQRLCLPDDWQTFTLQKLRHKLFLLPGELVRPQNRPVLRLNSAPKIQPLARTIWARIQHLHPLC